MPKRLERIVMPRAAAVGAVSSDAAATAVPRSRLEQVPVREAVAVVMPSGRNEV
jgi:hypothetical protein